MPAPTHTCPVCGYPGLEDPPRSASGGASEEICPSCGFQFGWSDDDQGWTYAAWRERWVADGMPWDRGSSAPPEGWDPAAQLARVTARPGERGQSTIEWVGIVAVVAVLLAALLVMAPSWGGKLTGKVACVVSGGSCSSGSGSASGGVTGGGGTGGGAGTGGASVPGAGSATGGGTTSQGGPEDEGPSDGEPAPELPADPTAADRAEAAAENAAREGGSTWGRPGTLARHLRDHGSDFGLDDPEEYAQQAHDFLQRGIDEHLPTKVDTDGTIRVYDPETNTFGSYNADGTTRTYYKPSGGQGYWDRQPGEDPWAGEGGGTEPGDDDPPPDEGGGPKGGGAPEEPVPEVPEVPDVPVIPELPVIPVIPELPIIIP